MIYLDHNATTRVLPEIVEAIQRYYTSEWGNPSSTYRFGYTMKSVLADAREQVALLLGTHPREIIFTSGGTEGNNTAINAALKADLNKRHIITSAVEHSSVFTYCHALAHEGYTITYLPVDREGCLTAAAVERAMRDDTAVVSLMWANNETGVIFPIEQIGAACRQRGVLFHCDAVQAIGKLPINLRELGVDYATITGHKINAPKGTGALYVHKKAPFSPFMHGGHQERNQRGGTENVPYVVAMGLAAAFAAKNTNFYQARVTPLRDQLETGILSSIPNTELNGHNTQRIANTSNITFHDIEAEALLMLLDKEDVCASSGSACLADSDEPSHVVQAMKPETGASRQSIRFSLGHETTEQQISLALTTIKKAAMILRG